MHRVPAQLKMSLALIICLLAAGCHGSEEATQESPTPAQPTASEAIQQEVRTLTAQNDSLRHQIGTLEEQNRTATAHAADLETQISELKEKLAARTAPPPKPSIENPLESYHQALTLFHSRNYQDAEALFQGCLDAGIDQRLQDNCTYWIGECEFGLHRYQEAIGQMQKVFDFKISEKKDDAQIMIANCYFAQGDKPQARAEYEKLIKKFPASPFVKLAKERLAKLGS